MKFPVEMIFLLFFLMPNFCFSMTLEEYIESVKKDDLEVRRFVHQRVQTRFNNDLQLPNSTWVATLTNTHGLALQENGKTTRRTTGSLSKNFRSTGTNIGVSYNKNSLADRAEEVKSIQLEQSLLKNFFGMQTREQQASLEEAAKVTLWQVVESYEDYIAQKTNEYLDFVLAFENYSTASELYSDIQSLKKEVDQRKKRNIALSVDVHRVSLQLLQNKRNRLEAKTQMVRLRQTLFSAFDGENEEISALNPSRVIPFVNRKINFKLDRQKFLERSRTIKIQKSQLKSAELNLAFRKKDYYPEGSLILGYSNDRSQRFSTLVNREEALIGFNLNFSFDSSVANAQVDQALYLKIQAELRNRSSQKQIEAQLDILQNEIAFRKERVEILEDQVNVAKKLVSGERSRFRNGRVDLETIINAQTSYQQARYQYVLQKVELAKSMVAWNQLTDQLVTQLNNP